MKYTTAFRATFDSDGAAQLELCRAVPSKLPFARAREELIPFDDWVLHSPPAATQAIARILQVWSDDEIDNDGKPLVQPAVTRVRLSPDLVVRLTDAEGQALRLPPAAQVSLNLRSHDHIASPNFRVDVAWTRTNGQPVHVRVVGARLSVDGKDWRLVEPIAGMLKHVTAVNEATDVAARQLAVAELRRALPQEHQDLVRADGFIERLRLSYAAAFSLSLETRGGGFDFDPVLFARDALVANEEEGQSLDEQADSLLPPNLQADFSSRFRSAGDRGAYLLGDGSIVFLDPSLRQALSIVRRAQKSGPEVRKAFARNPRRAIREALAEQLDENQVEALDTLFVETMQFSERVSGIDVWRKPVLPWVKPKPNSWLPEAFGLRVGEGDQAQDLTIEPAFVSEALARVEAALASGKTTIEIDGVQVPVTEQTREALQSLDGLVAASKSASAGDEPPGSLNERFFLQIRDNLADVEYAPLVVEHCSDVAEVGPPATLKSAMKPHQLDGLRWLVSAWRAATPGVVLADDMGLGKTYQALAFIAWLREQGREHRPALIVAPTGLLANWQSEIRNHLEPGALGRIVRAYGSELRHDGSRTKDIAAGSAQLEPNAWADASVVLTTFETMRDYHMSFARSRFGVIVYDEAQKLKNPASQTTRAAKTLNARFQIAMTGTPVENRLQDLWSIVDVIHPGLLGSSREFEARYPSTDMPRLKELHARLTQPQGGRPPVLLRRMKDDHLPGLPQKKVVSMPVEMPPAQAEAYAKAVTRGIALRGSGQGYMLEVLHQLRGISLHPRSPEAVGGDVDRYLTDSARLRATFDVLEKIKARGEKVLIFCESLAMQALLAVHIKRRFGLPHDIPRINGSVAGDARQQAVDQFQARRGGFDVLILSPKAGGVGLTLTAANHVIHLSRWWNPAVEDQATDRVYRIGQTREVYVYLPQAVHPAPTIRESSFDLKLDALMRQKRDLSRGLLVPPESIADAETLFDAVLVDNGAEQSTHSVPPAEDAALGEELAAGSSTEQATRARVGATVAIPPTTLSEASLAPMARRIFRIGDRRDFQIIEEAVRGEDLVSVAIRDPYACASPWHRGHLVEFAKRIQGSARSIATVSILAYDGESLDRSRPEYTEDQLNDLDRRWRQRFPNGPRLKPDLISRRHARGFHDRRVEAVTRSGRRIVWDLTNGIDGLMAEDKECTVFRVIEEVAP